MIPSETDFPFVLRRKQFPIRPAFCITINKCQRQSLESVGVFQYHLGNIYPSNENSGYCSPMDLSFDNPISDSDPESVPDDTEKEGGLPLPQIHQTELTKSLAGSVNHFSLLMGNHRAMSLDMQLEPILPIRSNRYGYCR